MNDVFYNLVSLDKPRERLTKKNIISLLILPVIAIALFATPTAAFASHNVRDGDASATDNTLISIHMLDKTHGWALTSSLVLKTADGGIHWQNVLPANAFGKTIMLNPASGTFLNDQDAWIAADVGPSPNGKSSPMHTIMVLRTTNGGKSWQSSTIQTPVVARTVVVRVATLDFLNASNGWLQAYSDAGVDADPGSSLSLIFHTTDGGQHYNQLASPNQKDIPYPSGISFRSPSAMRKTAGRRGWGTGLAP